MGKKPFIAVLRSHFHLIRSGGISLYKKEAVDLVKMADNTSDDYDSDLCRKKVEEMKREYKKLKIKLLQAASLSGLMVSRMVNIMDILARIRRVVEQAEKGARYLGEIRYLADVGDSGIQEWS